MNLKYNYTLKYTVSEETIMLYVTDSYALDYAKFITFPFLIFVTFKLFPNFVYETFKTVMLETTFSCLVSQSAGFFEPRSSGQQSTLPTLETPLTNSISHNIHQLWSI
jgi:hypothetical protein